MKTYKEPIAVEPKNGTPKFITWRNRRMRVLEIVDFWVYQSQWWAEEVRRDYLSVLTDAGHFEIYRSGDDWTLDRGMD